MTGRHPGRVITCSPAEGRTRRDQARTFLDVAELVLTEDRREAHVAAALAVLAGVAAADTICGLSLGRWSRGQDHAQAASLLGEVALQDPTPPTKLRRLLADKDAAHHSPSLITVDKANAMVPRDRATRCGRQALDAKRAHLTSQATDGPLQASTSAAIDRRLRRNSIELQWGPESAFACVV